jgi:hypothetical protein
VKAIFDIDFIVFAAASVMQETFITVTHPKLPDKEFDNRTQFWGHYKKREGGWLAGQVDLSGEKLYHPDEFTITEGVRLRNFKVKARFDDEDDTFVSPIEGAKRLIDKNIKDICEQLGVTEYYGYTGRGSVFRHDVATLLPYKGQRSDTKPLLLEELKDYVIAKHNITLVSGIEADDAVSMATVAAYKRWKASGKRPECIEYAVAIDKDSKQTEGWHFNPDHDEAPRLIEGLGKLWLDVKGDPDGSGRMWLYWQIAVGDSSDNYKANCFSDVKWAKMGGYNALKDCKTDKEAFTALVAVFKKLYPEKKVVEGCKGSVEIDWLFVFQELATMAMMLRHDGDKIDIKVTLDKLGVDH